MVKRLLIFFLAILAILGISLGSFTLGLVVLGNALEHSRVVEIVDGQEKFFITLWLGPFGYKIDVKERRGK
jgi:hypothetical protein